MRKLLITTLLFLPLAASAYSDHRVQKLDSLETAIAHWTPQTLAAASADERKAYCITCRDLAWGYLQVDAPRSTYYARRAIQTARLDGDQRSVFDASILIGQHFWAREQFDSARVYYNQAADALAQLEAGWSKPDTHDLESYQARLWGTLGNFYAAQDSLELFAYYYGKAGELFQKWEWWEDCATLHQNIGEVYADAGDLKKAKPEYELGLQYARQSGDSLMIARSLYGLGRWYQESGKTAQALDYLTQADEYFGNHAREEAYDRANTLVVMKDAYRQLYRSARIRALGIGLLLLLSIGIILVILRLKRTRQVLTETSAVLDETIEEMRPEEGVRAPETIHLTKREKDVAKLLMEGKTTQETAYYLGIGDETVLWYRKRLFAKLNVHSIAAFTSEMMKRGLP